MTRALQFHFIVMMGYIRFTKDLMLSHATSDNHSRKSDAVALKALNVYVTSHEMYTYSCRYMYLNANEKEKGRADP